MTDLPFGPECWKRIGVFSEAEPTCPLLSDLVHCRNCRVYAAAGRGLLDRASPPEYVADWTAAMAKPKPPTTNDSISVLIFRIEGEWLALPTRAFFEVTETKSIHRIPHARDPILLGVVNIRGQLHLCVSLALLLGLDRAASIETGDRASVLVYRRMMVIGSESSRWAFQVDEVYGMRCFPKSAIHDAPVTISRDKTTYTRGLLAFQEGLLYVTERRKNAPRQFADEQVGYLDDELLLYALERRVFAETGTP